MIDYPTDPATLSKLSAAEWDKLLDSVQSAPVPRPVVRLREYREPTLLATVRRLRAEGLKLREVADRLNISISSVNLILRRDKT